MSNTNPFKSNRLLVRLSRADKALMEKHLVQVDLPVGHELERPGQPIQNVYFLGSGFVSVLVTGTDDSCIDLGLIGREGMTGLPVVMGADRSPNRTIIQSASGAARISSGQLREAMDESKSLHQVLLLYAHAFFIQASYTAMANGHHTLEERLARWILMAHDRSDGNTLRLTHELLSVMLAVRRPGVTVAINALRSEGMIKAGRGTITNIDRKRLQKRSNGAYGPTEAEFNWLFG